MPVMIRFLTIVLPRTKELQSNLSARDLKDLILRKGIEKTVVDSDDSLEEVRELSTLKRPVLGHFTYRIGSDFQINLANGLPNLDLGFVRVCVDWMGFRRGIWLWLRRGEGNMFLRNRIRFVSCILIRLC